MSDHSDDLCSQVHCACRDGKAITLAALLLDKTDDQLRSALSHLSEENGQLTTPLLIAARNGHVKVVEILLTQYGVDPEQTGTVKFDGYTSDGACALWWAACHGHINVIKTLLAHGADVNHTTASNSIYTPLRVACFEGLLDVVALLLDRGADIHISNKFGNTCLMIASYKGHLEVVKYLLEHGSRPNDRALCNATALHFAADRGHLKIVKVLVENGAEQFSNERGLTPLLVAAESAHEAIVEYLIQNVLQMTREERIEAWELLGATFACDKDHYNLTKCYYYWHKAMEERFSSEANPLFKELLPPVLQYDNHTECQTLDELEAIKEDHNALHMEGLVVRERILGENDREIPHPIVFRGAVFADSGRFDRCIALWMRALFLRYTNNRSISKDLLRFAQVFSQMLYVEADLEYDLVEHVFEHCLLEFEKDDARIAEAKTPCEKLSAVGRKDVNIRTALYLLVILLKVKATEAHSESLCQLSYEFNRRNLRVAPSTKNSSPLHLACDENTQVDDFHVDDVVQFPNDELVKLLISCGADVNAVDLYRNTPLHVIVQYNRPVSDFHTLHNIIKSLTEAGAHIDRTNAQGKMPLDLVTTGVAETILRGEQRIKLQCIAAKAVKKFGLAYKGAVPVMLEEFIEMH
jgi:Fem-1 family protein b